MELYKSSILIFTFNKIYTEWNNVLDKIDDDKIIVCNNTKNILIISISELKIIKEIEIFYTCHSIKVFQKQGIILVGGKENYINLYNIYIYNIDNLELEYAYFNAHSGNITGFADYKYNNIISYSCDKSLKFWELH